MAEPDVKEAVKKLARRINGYKGKAKVDLTKLDHNFNSLEQNPASQDLLAQVKQHFDHVDASVVQNLYRKRGNCTSR